MIWSIQSSGEISYGMTLQFEPTNKTGKTGKTGKNIIVEDSCFEPGLHVVKLAILTRALAETADVKLCNW